MERFLFVLEVALSPGVGIISDESISSSVSVGNPARGPAGAGCGRGRSSRSCLGWSAWMASRKSSLGTRLNPPVVSLWRLCCPRGGVFLCADVFDDAFRFTLEGEKVRWRKCWLEHIYAELVSVALCGAMRENCLL